jgi:hypothetical protein
MVWDKANTVEPELLLADYGKRITMPGRDPRPTPLDKARYHYETWRKTTAMINPPPPWGLLDIRARVALCAVTYAVWQDAADESQPELDSE